MSHYAVAAIEGFFIGTSYAIARDLLRAWSERRKRRRAS